MGRFAVTVEIETHGKQNRCETYVTEADTELHAQSQVKHGVAQNHPDKIKTTVRYVRDISDNTSGPILVAGWYEDK